MGRFINVPGRFYTSLYVIPVTRFSKWMMDNPMKTKCLVVGGDTYYKQRCRDNSVRDNLTGTYIVLHHVNFLSRRKNN